MRKQTEQTGRWIEVEALCRCAQLERQYGAAMSEHLDQLDGDERLLAQMRRLSHQRWRWTRLRAALHRFRRGAAAVIKRLVTALDAPRSRPQRADIRYSASPSVSGERRDCGQRSARAIA